MYCKLGDFWKNKPRYLCKLICCHYLDRMGWLSWLFYIFHYGNYENYENLKKIVFWKYSKSEKSYFLELISRNQRKNILDPQNRDGKVDLRVFGEVWAWVDDFMLISKRYPTSLRKITQTCLLIKFYMMICLIIF